MRALLLVLVFASLSFAADRGTLITKINHGDYWISIYATKEGNRYDVNKATGELLAENASAEQLRKQVPDVYEFVKRSIAIDAGNETNAKFFLPKLDSDM